MSQPIHLDQFSKLTSKMASIERNSQNSKGLEPSFYSIDVTDKSKSIFLHRDTHSFNWYYEVEKLQGIV